MADVADSSDRWAIPVQPRDRALPTVTASQAARQVALMPQVGDPATNAQIELLARAYQLGVDSDDRANRHYVLVAGAGVRLDSEVIDEHELALRVLAQLGTMDAGVAWAPNDVQQRVSARHAGASRGDVSTPVSFPGTRHPATIVTLALETGDDPAVVKGTMTIESPDGRATRQGIEARRSGFGWSTIRLTGVRMSW